MISIQNLTKVYDGASGGTHALRDVSLEIPDGDIFGIIGISGAGKSTLVRCVNLLEQPTSGHIVVDGTDVTTLSGAELRAFRYRTAMIFQGFGLLAQKTALENVCFPLATGIGRLPEGARDKGLELLGRVGLADKADSYPAQLSGGQKQRVAIARALACDPTTILCDEATSALDPASTEQVLDLLAKINQETGVTMLVITHSMDVVRRICKHVAVLVGGEVVERGATQEIFQNPQHKVTKALLGKGDWNA
ncbi:MAG: ATP-binding cassette domain-containing protein [Atopobiaceae bacterium]|nr:ATP-binding cassette domain-containing protein [Atopobiaceae bacterium]